MSGGWTISEEKFFEPLRDVVASLKLRASWGQNGSLAALDGYAYSTDMAQGSIYPLVPGVDFVRQEILVVLEQRVSWSLPEWSSSRQHFYRMRKL